MRSLWRRTFRKIIATRFCGVPRRRRHKASFIRTRPSWGLRATTFSHSASASCLPLEAVSDVFIFLSPLTSFTEIYSPYRKFIKYLMTFFLLTFFMYDCACRLNFFDAPPTGRLWPHLVLPWLHARSHREKCRRLFSAMYRPGSGRRHGEGTETLWSWCGAFWPVMKKITSGHAIDIFQIMLLRLCVMKLNSWPTILFTSWALAVRKLGSFVASNARQQQFTRFCVADAIRERVEELKSLAELLGMDEAAVISAATAYTASVTGTGEAASQPPCMEDHVKFSILSEAGTSPLTPLLIALLATQKVTAPTQKHRDAAKRALKALEAMNAVSGATRARLTSSAEYEAAASDLAVRELGLARTEVLLRLEVVRITKEANAHNKYVRGTRL